MVIYHQFNNIKLSFFASDMKSSFSLCTFKIDAVRLLDILEYLIWYFVDHFLGNQPKTHTFLIEDEEGGYHGQIQSSKFHVPKLQKCKSGEQPLEKKKKCQMSARHSTSLQFLHSTAKVVKGSPLYLFYTKWK